VARVSRSEDETESGSRTALEAHQFACLRRLLDHTFRHNPFYRAKFAAAGFHSVRDLLAAATSPEGFRRLPTTTKRELLSDQATNPPYGTNVASAPVRFVRQHHTSGTTGPPLKVWDTRSSWDWLTGQWFRQYRALDITAADTIFMAFNFGRSLGFWNALDAGMRIGALVLTGGGLSSVERLESIMSHRATVLICTPTYSLRLAEVAGEHGIDLGQMRVRSIIAAGEPGGSVPGTRARIESFWQARVYDSPGATEVGHFGLACARQSVHLLESEFYVELLDPDTLQPVRPGVPGEIIITNFGRPAAPVIRYRTGDMARPLYDRCACGRTLLRLDGGIIGRSDDMVIVRGVNVFPSAIEAIIRESGIVSEYAVDIVNERGMRELKVRIEVDQDRDDRAGDIIDRIRDQLCRTLSLRAEVEMVPPRSLPRFEGKGRRIRVGGTPT
jgi:phenylacetate-CoA ligase